MTFKFWWELYSVDDENHRECVSLSLRQIMLAFIYSSYILNPNLVNFVWFLQASLEMGPWVRGLTPVQLWVAFRVG